MRKYETKNVIPVYKSFLTVEQSDVHFEKQNGEMSAWHTWYAVTKPDAVAVIVLDTEKDELLFVSQFRHAVIKHGDAFPVECVAGTLDGEEDPEQGALRELEEELGYRVSTLTHLANYYGSPAILTEMIYLYYTEVSEANRVNSGGGLISEGEDLQTIRIPNGEIQERLLAGDFIDGKTQVGLMHGILRGFFR